MQPAKRVSQRLISFELELDPAAQLFSYADTFGNAVYHFDIPQPHERLTIVARSAVETEEPSSLPDMLDRGEWDRLKSDFVRGEPNEMLFIFLSWPQLLRSWPRDQKRRPKNRDFP